jgi:hypothetical protein
MLKFSHMSTLTPSTNGVNWEKENSFQLSLTLASLSYQAAMAELVQAMRDGEKETITINTTLQINIPKSPQTPYTARDLDPKKMYYNKKRE